MALELVQVLAMGLIIHVILGKSFYFPKFSSLTYLPKRVIVRWKEM